MKYKIRSIFIAPKDKYLISCDLSQAESWVVAFLANELSMKDALMNGDIHSRTASVLTGIPEAKIRANRKSSDPKLATEANTARYIGKQGNHALAYRESPPMLMLSFNENSDKFPFMTITMRQAVKYHSLWHSYYTGIKQWWMEIENDLRQNYRTLITPYNRKRRFFGYWGDDLFKEATAFLPQSTVADHTFGKIQDELGIPGGIYGIYKHYYKHPEIKLIQTAHDSIMLESPKACYKEVAEVVVSNMRRPMVVKDKTFTIPAEVSYGERWEEGMEAINV